jgi:hypothetical protein
MEITMNTKTLMLAAMTALSLGAGAAMAQSRTTIYPGVGFAPPQVVTTGRAPDAGANGVQSGSSDVNQRAAPKPEDYRYQWGTLNNPG